MNHYIAATLPLIFSAIALGICAFVPTSKKDNPAHTWGGTVEKSLKN